MNKTNNAETEKLFRLASKTLLDAPRVGENFFDSLGTVRVMAVVENCWIVARRKHCAPFIQHVEMFNRQFKKESI